MADTGGWATGGGADWYGPLTEEKVGAGRIIAAVVESCCPGAATCFGMATFELKGAIGPGAARLLAAWTGAGDVDAVVAVRWLDC